MWITQRKTLVFCIEHNSLSSYCLTPSDLEWPWTA